MVRNGFKRSFESRVRRAYLALCSGLRQRAPTSREPIGRTIEFPLKDGTAYLGVACKTCEAPVAVATLPAGYPDATPPSRTSCGRGYPRRMMTSNAAFIAPSDCQSFAKKRDWPAHSAALLSEPLFLVVGLRQRRDQLFITSDGLSRLAIAAKRAEDHVHLTKGVTRVPARPH
jgi:hypothetical protein